MRNTVLTTLSLCLTVANCSFVSAGEGTSLPEIIEAPESHPDNWLQKQLPIFKEADDGTIVIMNALQTFTITDGVHNPKNMISDVDAGARPFFRQEDDGTIVIENAFPTFAITGDIHNPTDVIAFVDLGARSIMLRAKKGSLAYETLANNVTIKHGDARQPRFDIVGKIRYCAPAIEGHPDWLNPVLVLDVQTVNFYLVR